MKKLYQWNFTFLCLIKPPQFHCSVRGLHIWTKRSRSNGLAWMQHPVSVCFCQKITLIIHKQRYINSSEQRFRKKDILEYIKSCENIVGLHPPIILIFPFQIWVWNGVHVFILFFNIYNFFFFNVNLFCCVLLFYRCLLYILIMHACKLLAQILFPEVLQ